jgi:hypothetical protein
MLNSSISILGYEKPRLSLKRLGRAALRMHTCTQPMLISTSSERITINVDKVQIRTDISGNSAHAKYGSTTDRVAMCSHFYKVSSFRSLSAVQSLRRTTHALLRANAGYSRPSRGRRRCRALDM